MTATSYAVRFTLEADKDLELLYDYVAETRSAREADALLDRILDRIGSLESFPHRGAVPKELDDLGTADFRQTLVSPYRLIYRVIETTVVVVLIADGRRDMAALLKRRLLGR